MECVALADRPLVEGRGRFNADWWSSIKLGGPEVVVLHVGLFAILDLLRRRTGWEL